LKLILVLFAMLTGFAGADRASSVPVAPVELGALTHVAQQVAGVTAAVLSGRPVAAEPPLADVADCPDVPGTVTLAQLALPTRADRARE
jgi:hypothetical protein